MAEPLFIVNTAGDVEQVSLQAYARWVNTEGFEVAIAELGPSSPLRVGGAAWANGMAAILLAQ